MISLSLRLPLSLYRKSWGSADGLDLIQECPPVQIPNIHLTRLCDPQASRQTSFVISSTVRVSLNTFLFWFIYLTRTPPRTSVFHTLPSGSNADP